MKKWLLLCLLLASCAINPQKSFYSHGKKYGSVAYNRGENTWTLNGYDQKGRLRYTSKFKSDGLSDLNLGIELTGSRTEFDTSGIPISRWDIDSDGVHSRYERKSDTESIVTYFHDAKPDSLFLRGKSGDVKEKLTYSGKRHFYFSQLYLSVAPFGFIGLAQRMPYDFDTLVSETFNPKLRATNGWSFRTRDTIIEKGFNENGTLIREFACSKRTDSLCAHPTLNEWSKEGKPTIAQENLGNNRYRHRHYYDNGKMMTESNYSGTKLDGKYHSWWESGKLNQEIDYRAGKETHWKEWDKSGKLIKDESY